MTSEYLQLAKKDMVQSQTITNKIKEIVSAYKNSFSQIDKEERYKWKAIGTYKNAWNIEASDFAGMLKMSFKDMDNLLTAGRYFAYKMLIEFAEKDPETVRALFRILYDEQLSFEERFSKFRKGFSEYYNPKELNHYQDLHAISVYLTCEYPEKYYIYKYSVVKEFIKKIGFECDSIDAMNDAGKMELLLNLHNTVLEVIDRDEDLKELSSGRLDETCYQDYALHLLANDVVYFGSKYEDELKERLVEMDLTINVESNNSNEFDKNIILYGPPGTGKTYNTAIYAVAIVENKSLDDVAKEDYSEIMRRYNLHKQEGRIEFTTFHQSYGYEEFIEGIKPIVSADNESDVSYKIVPGIFKAFCEGIKVHEINESDDLGLNDYPTVWKVSLEGTGYNETRRECLENNHIRIGYDSYGEDITEAIDWQENGYSVLNRFVNEMSIGDIVVSCFSATEIDAIGIVTGNYEWKPDYQAYKRLRKVNWLAKGFKENILKINNGNRLSNPTVHRVSMTVDDVMKIAEKHSTKYFKNEDRTVDKDNYVFIIDEINRGNISKILGELITLIEPSKRIGQLEEMKARLPYSKGEFGVPDNVYIIGTMNTADRSIAAIDTALRRRFSFKEMLPEVTVLEGIDVEGINISDMLEKINRRIEVLYDREHTIGHAYFIPLKEDNSIEKLADIFKNKILPLLQEYFYEDYEKIRLVLGDNQKSADEPQFILKESVVETEIFGEDIDFIEDFQKYIINEDAFLNIEAYKKML